MAQQAFIEMSTLLILTDILATDMAMEDPTIAFSLIKSKEDGLWECTIQVGPVREQVRNKNRAIAVKNLSEVLKLRIGQASRRS
jgi:hypothetical protein